jgi:antitoxin HicB
VNRPLKYPKQVFWSDEDEGFVATAPDLPGSSAIGDTEADALAELDSAIEAWIDAAVAAGNSVPAPSKPALRGAYSGKLLVRMPRSLHEELAKSARREDVSLNQYIVFVLSRYFSVTARSEEVRMIGGGVQFTAATEHNLRFSWRSIVFDAGGSFSTSNLGISSAGMQPLSSSTAVEGGTGWVQTLGDTFAVYSSALENMTFTPIMMGEFGSQSARE